jgi:hypothetical protein
MSACSMTLSRKMTAPILPFAARPVPPGFGGANDHVFHFPGFHRRMSP